MARRGGKSVNAKGQNQQEQEQSTTVPTHEPPPGFNVNAPEFVPPPGLSIDGPPPGLPRQQRPPQSGCGAPPPGLDLRFQQPPPPSSSHQSSSSRHQKQKAPPDATSSIPSQVLFQQKPQNAKSDKKPRNQQERPRKNSGGNSNRNMTSSENQQERPHHHHNQHYREFQGPTEECILCCQRSDVFGVGQCKHPACMECVIRIRCLGESTKCHACREDIQMINFVMKPSKWEDFKLPACLVTHPDHEKFNICFENQYIMDLYDKYNAFSCHLCQRQGEFADFPNFAALKQHTGQQHKLFFCHICLDHLNILPKNRRTFNEKELQLHMTGKKNVVQGIRGHPKCEFCNQRYFDDEELYKHSRNTHHFCSICSTEVGINQFFNRIEQLHKHYKQKHHPCLEPECVGIVFGSEFDLNVHKTERHNGTDRKIPINFEFSRGQSRYAEPSTRVNQSHGITIIPSNQPPPQQPTNIILSAQTTGHPINLVQRPAIVEQHDFPTLASTNAPNAYSQGTNWRANLTASRKPERAPAPSFQQQIGSTSHFPTLGGPTSSRGAKPTQGGVWNSGKTMEVMKKPPVVKEPSPKPMRRKIIPLPEAWPENMRRKLEAREQGLPEPEDLEPPLPQPPLEPKKKERKPKKKTVGLEVLKKRLNDQGSLNNESTSTKFNVLADIN